MQEKPSNPPDNDLEEERVYVDSCPKEESDKETFKNPDTGNLERGVVISLSVILVVLLWVQANKLLNLNKPLYGSAFPSNKIEYLAKLNNVNFNIKFNLELGQNSQKLLAEHIKYLNNQPNDYEIMLSEYQSRYTISDPLDGLKKANEKLKEFMQQALEILGDNQLAINAVYDLQTELNILKSLVQQIKGHPKILPQVLEEVRGTRIQRNISPYQSPIGGGYEVFEVRYFEDTIKKLESSNANNLVFLRRWFEQIDGNLIFPAIITVLLSILVSQEVLKGKS